jgi:hypothetical protein
MDNERRPGGLREELEGPDEAGHTTALTGASGESARNDDPVAGDRPPSWPEQDETPLDNDETVIAGSPSGGSPPGAVAPPPGADWPDPMGRDDEERELERRTR